MTGLQEFLIAAAVVIVCIVGGLLLAPAWWAFTHPATEHTTHRARARSIQEAAEKRRLIRLTFALVELDDAANGEYLALSEDPDDGTQTVCYKTTEPNHDGYQIAEPLANVTIHEIAAGDGDSVPRVEYSALCYVAADPQDQEFLEEAELVEIGEEQIDIYVPAGLGLPA